MAIDHDEVCREHTRAMAELRVTHGELEKFAKEVLDRAQEMVDQWNSTKLDIERRDGATKLALSEIEGNVKAVGVDVGYIKKHTDEIEKSLKDNYALRTDVADTKSEGRKMFGGVLAFLGVVVLTVLGWLGTHK